MPFVAGQTLTAADLNELSQPVKGVRITNSGNPIATTSGTTELDLPLYAMSGLSLVTGTYYIAEYLVTFTRNNTTDTFDFKLRVNTATTGTQIGNSPADPTVGRTIGYFFLRFLFVGDSSYTSLHLSAQRNGGATSTLSYYGAASGNNRAYAILHNMGTTDVWSDAS